MKQGDKFIERFTVTPFIYESFIQAYQDKNPLHTNHDFAIAQGVEGMVMHGNILNGFVSYFVGECLPVKNVILLSQSIKYILPVYLNNELEFNAEITGVFESVNTYEFKFSFRNQRDKKVAKGEIQIKLLL